VPFDQHAAFDFRRLASQRLATRLWQATIGAMYGSPQYAVVAQQLDEQATCAVCGEQRIPKVVLGVPPESTGADASLASSAETLAVCEECAPADWEANTQVTGEALADLRARRRHANG